MKIKILFVILSVFYLSTINSSDLFISLPIFSLDLSLDLSLYLLINIYLQIIFRFSIGDDLVRDRTRTGDDSFMSIMKALLVHAMKNIL